MIPNGKVQIPMVTGNGSLWSAGLWDHTFSKVADTVLADKEPPLSPPAFSQTYDTNRSVGRAQRCSLRSPLGALATCFAHPHRCATVHGPDPRRGVTDARSKQARLPKLSSLSHTDIHLPSLRSPKHPNFVRNRCACRLIMLLPRSN